MKSAVGLIKERHRTPVVYLTAFSDEHIIEQAVVTEPFGYLLKPFQPRELKITIEMALYKAKMENELRRTMAELERALSEVKKLGGLLPVCANCKKIRNDQGYWEQVEVYVRDHSEAEFSHGICPQCAKELYPEFFGEK